VSALPLTRRAIDRFDHPGLFMVPLGRSPAMPAAAKTRERPTMQPGRARVAPTERPKSGLHRYCRGCAQETEHVAWTADGRGSIPSIRWPNAKPAIGTTICLNCGQWRAATPNLGRVGASPWRPGRTIPLPVVPSSSSTSTIRQHLSRPVC
jgi:hypothetical protein